MYPKPEDELRGWTVHALAVGTSHNVVHADDATISWGSGCASGELGLGTKKSSANPAKVDALVPTRGSNPDAAGADHVTVHDAHDASRGGAPLWSATDAASFVVKS